MASFAPTICARRRLVERGAGLPRHFEQLVAYALPRGNDLEAPAARLVPEIRGMLASLLALPGARIVRLSGSGPTCFALFASEDDARRAGARLAAEFPNWWIAAAALAA